MCFCPFGLASPVPILATVLLVDKANEIVGQLKNKKTSQELKKEFDDAFEILKLRKAGVENTRLKRNNTILIVAVIVSIIVSIIIDKCIIYTRTS